MKIAVFLQHLICIYCNVALLFRVDMHIPTCVPLFPEQIYFLWYSWKCHAIWKKNKNSHKRTHKQYFAYVSMLLGNSYFCTARNATTALVKHAFWIKPNLIFYLANSYVYVQSQYVLFCRFNWEIYRQVLNFDLKIWLV